MTWKLTSHGRVRPRKARLLAAALAAAGFALAAGAPAAQAETLYPDLRMQAPSEVHLQSFSLGGPPHHFVRFATKPTNVGQGPLEVHRAPTPSGIADLTQRIYDTASGFRDEPLGSVAFNPVSNVIFPVPDIARYELWTERTYKRAVGSDFKRGQPLYVQHMSHCLVNSEPVDSNTPHVPNENGVPYYRCTSVLTGLSVGWRHHQSWFDDQQWIDVGLTPLPDGEYIIRVIADPTNLLHESANKSDPARESDAANSATTYFQLINGQLAGIDPDF